MSGIFGIIDPQTNVRTYLDLARSKMTHLPHQTSDIWTAANAPLGIGRLGIGIFNREAQPYVNGQITVFLSGELYRTDALRTRLVNAGCASPITNDLELVSCAYQVFGDKFAAHLDGQFFIAVWADNRLTLAADRYGLYPHYYTHRPGQLAFAPEVKGVLCAPFVDRQKLDYAALAQYVRFQHLLADHTFHAEVKLFPYGGTGVFNLSDGTFTLTRYWDWGDIKERPEITLEEAVPEVSRRLRAGVEEMSKEDDLRPGVFLSGGLDSRTLLGLMKPRTPAPVTASFGHPDSRDVYYARKIAQVMGSNHHWFDLSGSQWVLDNVDLHLKLTEGFASWIHMHSISMLPKLRGLMDYNLTGWDGGTTMGDPDLLLPMFMDPVDFETILGETFRQNVQGYTWWGITEPDERLLYTPETFAKIDGLAFETMKAELRRFWDMRPNYAAEYFFLTNFCLRFTSNMVTTARSHIEVRAPFWDYPTIEYMYSLKPEVRAHSMLYRHLITRETPALSRIPYDRNEIWPTTQPLLHRTQKLAMKAMYRLKLRKPRPTLYADYENYVRGDLRGWVEGLLFDKHTTERGLFQPEFVRSLVARHMANHPRAEMLTIGKIAPLITLEMMMRDLMD